LFIKTAFSQKRDGRLAVGESLLTNKTKTWARMPKPRKFPRAAVAGDEKDAFKILAN
jgi:hypothetical protein